MAWPVSALSRPFNAILRYNQEPTRPFGGLVSSYWGQMGVPWEWLTQDWVLLPSPSGFMRCQGRAGFFPRTLIQFSLPLSLSGQGDSDGSPLICPAGPLRVPQSLLPLQGYNPALLARVFPSDERTQLLHGREAGWLEKTGANTHR